ncbi:transcriptional activator of glycolytic enzymes-domain-containing protein [Plectosphaerella cucumerina]|uniref:Transcriptional activator of glycolytic enzymes-domain-containing protein n=1 Tax=Plectosphaerella cucumerina TaxID=40658 RepID=A0A8K0T8W9_9PEZI|nr:transcriptional activator of glycolytic enzymes-domain-containing protein [Plectosphaerella cucumerina]
MGAKMLAHAQELEKKLEDALSELARQSDKQEEAVDDKFEVLRNKVDDLETQKFELLRNKSDGSKAPVYFFRKHPDTVWQQWAEYAHGLDGQPAVRDLDDRHGVTWRKETYARTWYYRRKRFWTLILDLQKSGLSEEDALAEVERRRGDRTVAKLVDDLVKQAKVPKREKSVDLFVSRESLKRERADLEEDEDLSEGVDEEKTAKRTTATQLRKRTVHPPETISIWDCEDNEM